MQAGLPLGALQYFDGTAAFRQPEPAAQAADPRWEAPPIAPPSVLDVLVVGGGVTA